MASWVPFAMLVLAGFLIGGVISFARSKHWVAVAVLGLATVLSLIAAYVWWHPA